MLCTMRQWALMRRTRLTHCCSVASVRIHPQRLCAHILQCYFVFVPLRNYHYANMQLVLCSTMAVYQGFSWTKINDLGLLPCASVRAQTRASAGMRAHTCARFLTKRCSVHARASASTKTLTFVFCNEATADARVAACACACLHTHFLFRFVFDFDSVHVCAHKDVHAHACSRECAHYLQRFC